MTHDQMVRESQEADRIRASTEKKAEESVTKEVQDVQKGPVSEWYGNAMKAVEEFGKGLDKFRESGMGQALGNMYDSGMNAMADINRRVVEEPWFGKPVQDILFDRQRNPIQRDRNVEQEAAKAEPAQQGTVHGQPEQQQEEQTTVHGKNEPQQGQDNFWEEFFGKQQAAEVEQSNQQEQGR
jgi:hypothetical protein